MVWAREQKHHGRVRGGRWGAESPGCGCWYQPQPGDHRLDQWKLYAEHRKHFNSKRGNCEPSHSRSCCSRGSPTLWVNYSTAYSAWSTHILCSNQGILSSLVISTSLSTLQEIDKYSIISQTTQTQSSSGGSTCVRLLFPLPLRRSQRRRQAFETAGRTGCLLMLIFHELTALMTSLPNDDGCRSAFWNLCWFQYEEFAVVEAVVRRKVAQVRRLGNLRSVSVIVLPLALPH